MLWENPERIENVNPTGRAVERGAEDYWVQMALIPAIINKIGGTGDIPYPRPPAMGRTPIDLGRSGLEVLLGTTVSKHGVRCR